MSGHIERLIKKALPRLVAQAQESYHLASGAGRYHGLLSVAFDLEAGMAHGCFDIQIVGEELSLNRLVSRTISLGTEICVYPKAKVGSFAKCFTVCFKRQTCTDDEYRCLVIEIDRYNEETEDTASRNERISRQMYLESQGVIVHTLDYRDIDYDAMKCSSEIIDKCIMYGTDDIDLHPPLRVIKNNKAGRTEKPSNVVRIDPRRSHL